MDIGSIKNNIEREYRDAGHELGWRFLYSPIDMLENANIVFLGLNPGGECYDPPQFSFEGGSAFTHEAWGNHQVGTAPLQKQVQRLCKTLLVSPSDILSGNLVPFRSRSWKHLKNKRRTLDFSYKLWEPILAKRALKIITISKVVEHQVTQLLGAKKVATIHTGWGKVSARYYENSTCKIFCLPHLGRYQIFGRGKTMELETLLIG